ncbi:MAG: T9SS type A sorting domain-containing protein [Bacteroidota bacterium]
MNNWNMRIKSIEKNFIFTISVLLFLIINIDTKAQPLQNAVYLKENSTLPLSNATSFLYTPTYDNSGQACHPSIIDFKHEYNIESWNGYRYWMAMTPAPFGSNIKENPSIIASKDGINWVVPSGITNPLVTAPGTPFYYSDPDLIYNPDNDELWLYFRYCNTVQLADNIRLIIIYNDLSYSQPVVVLDDFPYCESNRFFSPCIWRESYNKWHMWGVTLGYQQPMMYTNSVDGIHWNTLQMCLNEINMAPFPANGFHAWHPSCKPNYRENRIEFLMAANPLGVTPVSTCNYIFYAECPMNNPTLVTIPISSPILVKSTGFGWDNNIIYRSSFQIVDTNSSYMYRIWYSACDLNCIWRIGYVEGNIGSDYTQNEIIYADEYNNTTDHTLSCFPNPFISSTTVSYFVNNTGLVSLSVFDMKGNEIEKLVNQNQNKGVHTLEINSDRLDKGVYILLLKSGNRKEMIKIVKMK